MFVECQKKKRKKKNEQIFNREFLRFKRVNKRLINIYI